MYIIGYIYIQAEAKKALELSIDFTLFSSSSSKRYASCGDYYLGIYIFTFFVVTKRSVTVCLEYRL